MQMIISDYRDTDSYRCWELLYEGFYLVLLSEESPAPYSSQLLAFRGYGELVWSLSPQTTESYDYIVNVWVKNGDIYAGSFSGFEHRLSYITGEVLDTKFTK